MARTIYLAAPWVNRADASAAKKLIVAAGHTITSRWIDDHPDIPEGSPTYFADMQKQAVEDLNDVSGADTFVILNLGKSEGKATELGYALAINRWQEALGPMDIFLVGDRSINIFYHVPEVTQVADLNELIERLK